MIGIHKYNNPYNLFLKHKYKIIAICSVCMKNCQQFCPMKVLFELVSTEYQSYSS